MNPAVPPLPCSLPVSLALPELPPGAPATWPELDSLSVRTLGAAEVRCGGRPAVWPARSAEALLWYLHAHPAGVYRARLLAELWGLDEDKASLGRFRVALHRLRQVLGHPAGVLDEGGRYRLHPAVLDCSDAAALCRWADAAARAAAQGDLPAYEQALRAAVQAGAGEYLPQLDTDWVRPVRQRLAALQSSCRLELSSLLCSQLRCTESLQWLRSAAAHDPLMGEDHHQRLMGCLAQQEGKYRAAEYFRRYVHFLRAEVGDTPLPETWALIGAIKSGDVTCVRAPDRQAVASAPAGPGATVTADDAPENSGPENSGSENGAPDTDSA